MPPHGGFAALDPLLRPASVAVIGASDDPTRIGGRPIAYMLSQGFKGRLMPVNPQRSTVQGLPAFASVDALPEAPDAAIIAVPSAVALETVQKLGARGCRSAIVFTAGFAEMSEEGARHQQALVDAARAHGMRLLGPNCLGVFNAAIGFYPIFSSSFENGFPKPGRIGIASQSGAYGTHIFAASRDRNMGTPLLITTGNEADVSLGECIGWLAQAPEVDVICAYAEGIRESARFTEALELARRNRKPVVMMKVGRSALGGEAAKSHTASIAGDDQITQAVLDEFGVVRARSTEEMLDIAYAATQRVYPVGNTLGVVTISGGAGVLISDAAEVLGLPMPAMPAPAQARLKELLPFAAPRNPVDCTAQAFNDMNLIGQFTRSMVEDGEYRSVLAFFTQVGGSSTISPKLRAQLKSVRDQHPDRLWVLSVLAPPAKIAEYESDGFLVFEDPTRATTAIAAMGRYGEAFARPPCPVEAQAPAVELPATTPDEAEAKRILAAAGLPIVPEYACTTAAQAEQAAEAMGFPVVLKILSPDIQHKSEIGGVILDVASPEDVRRDFALLQKRAREKAPDARLEGVLVAKQIKGAVEIALGVHRDPVFGPVVMVGLGGIFIEVMKDVRFHRCPVDATTAERMIRSLRGFPLLDGARGRPPADIPALAEAVAALSRFAMAAGPRLRGVDINPLMVMPAGQGCFAADAVLDLQDDA